ncbi:unnamed protein product, partial [Pylaiella littoralis]
ASSQGSGPLDSATVSAMMMPREFGVGPGSSEGGDGGGGGGTDGAGVGSSPLHQAKNTSFLPFGHGRGGSGSGSDSGVGGVDVMDLTRRSSRSVSSTPVGGERAVDGGGGGGSGSGTVGTIGSSRNNNSSSIHSSIHSSPALPGYDVASSSAVGGADADAGFPVLDIGGAGRGF